MSASSIPGQLARRLGGFPKGLAGLAIAAAVFVTPGAVNARDSYPGYIQQRYGVPCPPPCTLCHTVPEGGNENLRDTEGFLLDLISIPGQLAYPGTDTELGQVLDLLETGPCQVATDPNFMTGPCDYDGDGKSDIDELRVGEDPNVSGSGVGCSSAVTYGCGARVAPAPPEKPFDALALLLSLATAAALLARVRR